MKLANDKIAAPDLTQTPEDQERSPKPPLEPAPALALDLALDSALDSAPAPSQTPEYQDQSQETLTAPSQAPKKTPGKAKRKANRSTVRKRVFTVLSLTLTVILVWAIARFVWQHFSEFKALWQKPIPAVVWVMLPVSWLLMVTVNSELLRWPVTAYGIKLTFLEGLALNMAASAINYVIPLKSGSGLRGLYLFSNRGMRVSHYLATLGSVTTMTLSTASFFAFVGLVYLWAQGHQPSPILPIYFGSTALFGLGSVLFLGRMPFKLPSKLQAIADGWDLLRSNGRLFLRLTVLQAGYFFSWAFFNWVTLAAFGVYLNPFEIVFFSGGQIHATIVNLTPAGLGVVEAFSVYAGKVMEFTPAEALSAQGLNRLTAVIMLAFFGLWGWLYLTRLIRREKISAPPKP
ncbi:MAG: flippase-like domain-containing protein [Deltaproteobacteria bacterium]|nr:flippase-like domain-containing protein [Deltaproteobacteria bacterium]